MWVVHGSSLNEGPILVPLKIGGRNIIYNQGAHKNENNPDNPYINPICTRYRMDFLYRQSRNTVFAVRPQQKRADATLKSGFPFFRCTILRFQGEP